MNEKWQTGVPGSQLQGSCWCFWAGLRCSVAEPRARLGAWLCQAGGAERCERGCGCWVKGAAATSSPPKG